MRVPVKSERVLTRVLEGEAVAVDPQTAWLHAMNPTATRIWEWVDGIADEAELARRLCREFAVEPERARADVARLLDEFERLGILTRSEPTRTP